MTETLIEVFVYLINLIYNHTITNTNPAAVTGLGILVYSGFLRFKDMIYITKSIIGWIKRFWQQNGLYDTLTMLLLLVYINYKVDYVRKLYKY